MNSYTDLKKGLAKQWRSVAGGENPHCIDEFFDVVLDRPDVEEVRKPHGGSHYKVIVSGHVVEVYEYEKPVKRGKNKNVAETYLNDDGEVMKYDYETNEWVQKYVEHPFDSKKTCVRGYDPSFAKKQNARYARLNLRRIITANFDTTAKFITLTFADGAVPDVTNIRECNQSFDRFMKRMRKRFGNFKYVKVVEFQDGNDRGAVHFHMMADLPYIRYDTIAEIWGNGFIGVNRIDQVDNLGAYMTKYMMKNFDDARLRGEKAYSSSKGLIRPVEIHGDEAVEIIAQYTDGKKEVFANSYESEYQGEIKYREYNLKRDET